MLPEEFSLHNDFPPADYEQWRYLAEQSLAGAPFEKRLVTTTYEGINIQPLYSRRDRPQEPNAEGFPGAPPFVRGSHPLGQLRSGWDLRQEHAHPDLDKSNAAILEDLSGGVTSLLLRLDVAARGGLDPDDALALDAAGRDGMMVYHVDDLDGVLSGVHLEMVGLALEAGAGFLPAAAIVAALWERRGTPADHARGAFNADPLAVFARDGGLPCPPDRALALMAQLARWTSQTYPHVTAVRVGSAPYHHAGASSAQDIGFAMGTAVEYLRAMTAAGMSIDDAARQMLFSISVGTHHFLAIAKLRAARKLWSRVVEACGGSPEAGAMRLHSRTSKRVLTQRDPYVNLLRNTAGVFAAGLGGADAITSVPFDAALGLPDDFSRRIARNTLLILQEEAHLHLVADAVGGSWFIDSLTDEVADKGWEIFQEIERQGGMLACLQNGWVHAQIESAFAPRAKNLARRKEGITGVSEFPDVGERPIVKEPIERDKLVHAAAERVAQARLSDPPAAMSPKEINLPALVAAAGQGASLGQLAAAIRLREDAPLIPPLHPHPFAEPFEQLRDASDAWRELRGTRPRVFLANMGPVSHYTARNTYAKNLFEAGGFETIGAQGFVDPDAAASAFVESGAQVAVICSSDKLYPEVVPQLAPKLKTAGARSVVLAGNPGEMEAEYRAAGIDRFIFIKCDVLGVLREMLQEEGVLA